MAYTMKLKRNRTYRKTFTWKAGGVPVNATGKTLAFHLQKKESSRDYLLLTTDDTAETLNSSRLVWINRTGGQFELLLTDEETKAFPYSLNGGTYSFSEPMANGDNIPKVDGPVTLTT